MLLDPAMFSGRDKEHWLNILLGKKNHTPVFCKCASCILKMTPYRDHVKENKITAFCLKKKAEFLESITSFQRAKITASFQNSLKQTIYH